MSTQTLMVKSIEQFKWQISGILLDSLSKQSLLSSSGGEVKATDKYAP